MVTGHWSRKVPTTTSAGHGDHRDGAPGSPPARLPERLPERHRPHRHERDRAEVEHPGAGQPEQRRPGAPPVHLPHGHGARAQEGRVVEALQREADQVDPGDHPDHRARPRRQVGEQQEHGEHGQVGDHEHPQDAHPAERLLASWARTGRASAVGRKTANIPGG